MGLHGGGRCWDGLTHEFEIWLDMGREDDYGGAFSDSSGKMCLPSPGMSCMTKSRPSLRGSASPAASSELR